MNIVISGYGRMGKEVEKIALNRNHHILATIDTTTDWEKISTLKAEIEAVIDFSLPESAFENIERCFKMGIPVVTGTTGWYNHLNEIKEKCKKLNGTLFYAPNFSVGVNIFFKANQQLARMMNGIEGYKVSIKETHHIHKLDAPSGTAIKSAEDIIAEIESLTEWVNTDKHEQGELPVLSNREGMVPGTHEVLYDSDVDELLLKHKAKSRAGFALGAVLAAEFVANKKGVFTMDDLLQF